MFMFNHCGVIICDNIKYYWLTFLFMFVVGLSTNGYRMVYVSRG